MAGQHPARGPTKPDGEKNGYGIAQFSWAGNTVTQHGGETPGYNAFIGVDTANQMTLVIWCNQPVTTNLLPTVNSMMIEVLDQIYVHSPKVATDGDPYVLTARWQAAPHTLAGMPTPPATTDPPTTRESLCPMVRAASEWAWRSIVIGLALVALLYLLGFLSEVVIPLTVGLLLCALLSSIHLRLARVMPRAAAAGVTVLGTLLVIAGLLVLVGTQISGGFDTMSAQVGQGIGQIREWIGTRSASVTCSSASTSSRSSSFSPARTSARR